MITREQFMAMTDQQKWDQYTLLLSECGDSDEAVDTDAVHAVGGVLNRYHELMDAGFDIIAEPAKKYPPPSGMLIVRKTDVPGEYEWAITP